MIREMTHTVPQEVPLDLIPLSMHKIADITSIRASIAVEGLQEPICLFQSQGRYVVACGRRRLAAIRSLIFREELVWDRRTNKEGPACEVYKTVPARVVPVATLLN